MSYIIRNNVKYACGGSSEEKSVELTQAEYDALEAKTIKVWACGTCGQTQEVEGTSKPTSCTNVICVQHDESYEQNWILKSTTTTESKIDPNTTYYITDADDQYNASSVVFDDTNTQLGAVNVQGAIEKTTDAINELNSNINNALDWELIATINTTNTIFDFISDNYKEVMICGQDAVCIRVTATCPIQLFKTAKCFQGNAYTTERQFVELTYISETTATCAFSKMSIVYVYAR